MINSAKSSALNTSVNSRVNPAFSTRTALRSSSLEQAAQPQIQFGTRSRQEIGTFDRVFTTSGSVRRSFDDVFRFNLTRSRRVRIYLGNEFSNPNSNSRRMTLSLIDDRTLRRVTSTTVRPTGVDAITRSLNPGTYRISISTQSNNRGRYFMDMVRV